MEGELEIVWGVSGSWELLIRDEGCAGEGCGGLTVRLLTAQVAPQDCSDVLWGRC